MGKHSKRKKHTRRGSAGTAQPRGFDYGCLALAAAVATFEFPGHLSAASVNGVAYGGAWSEAVNQTVPTISLVAQNGSELLKAFEAFNAWSGMTDPDSVELTFVFRNTGGYVLAISPEYSRLERRCLGFDRTHRAMAFAPTWFKPIDSVHPLLRRFRQHCTAPIAPFLFDGVTHAGSRDLLTTSPTPPVLPIPGVKPLLKFEVTFIDEADVTPNSIGWLALRVGSEPRTNLPKSTEGPPKPDPADLAKQRVKTLAHHFPVTLERVRRHPSVPLLFRELTQIGVKSWQLEQALCNLVLSAEIGRGPHYSGLSTRKFESGIIKALRSRYELADGGSTPTFTAEEVRTQILADANALLRFLGHETSPDLTGVQAALRSASALDATGAIDPPAAWAVSL
jgi:hypothetical protein